MNKRYIIISSLILFIGIIWLYSYNKYTGKYIGFKCGDKSHNNIFILNRDGTFVFKSDNLSNDVTGKWTVTKKEDITFTNQERKIKDIGTIVRYNLHTNREEKSTNIPYANGCRVYIGPR